MPEKSYLATEAADAVGVSVPTVKKMVRDRKLRGWHTPGGHLRISAESVRQFLEGSGTKETQHRGEPSGVLQNRRERVEEINLGNQELRATRDANKLRKELADDAERERVDQQRKEREQRQEEERNRLEQQRIDRDRRDQTSAAQAQRQDRERDRLERENSNRERQNAIAQAEEVLPSRAKSFPSVYGSNPTPWQIKLRRKVREAIAELSVDASPEEIRDTAIEAGQAVAQEYKEEHAAEDRKQSRETARQGMKTDADIALWHVRSYLGELEKDDNFTFADREWLIEKLEKRILPELLEEICADPDLSSADRNEIVEGLVDDYLPEFVDEEED